MTCRHGQEEDALSKKGTNSGDCIPSSTPIGSLPTELLHMVCNNLAISDVKSFRRTNKRFSEIGLEHLIPSLYFCLSPTSFARFDTITSHPVLRKHVKEIQFNGQCFTCPTEYWETNGPLYLREVKWDKYYQQARYERSPEGDFECIENGSWSFEEAIQAVLAGKTLPIAHFDAFPQMLCDTNNPDFLNKFLSERFPEPQFTDVADPFFKEGSSSMEISKIIQGLSQRVKKHRDVVRWQHSMWAQNLDFGAIIQALKQLPALRAIKLSPEGWDMDEWQIAESQNNWFDYGGDKTLNAPGMHSGVRQLNALLAGCREAGTRLDSLVVEAVSWRFFAQPFNAFDLEVLSTLSTLTMRISVTTLDDDEEPSDEANKCIERLGDGIIYHFLRKIRLLKHLDLVIVNYYGEFSPLHDIIGDITWHGLKSLVLKRVVTEEKTLVSILGRHMATLKSLSLHMTTLTGGHWRSAWKQIRSLIATYGLDDLRVGYWHSYEMTRWENGVNPGWWFRWRGSELHPLRDEAEILRQYLMKGEGSIDEPEWRYVMK
ncbi:hypothetical protein BU16DRAFT_557351 [Lophium mytilinum]|uniref:F-box domain-containing protein n=1 Tax=Lophium mytilinum TaxID=390894 RepID=A0A6A6R2R1_9PEZI|nr:hypothetical protein BU16DRAFT_557351 [Lophium mytilinum]